MGTIHTICNVIPYYCCSKSRQRRSRSKHAACHIAGARTDSQAYAWRCTRWWRGRGATKTSRPLRPPPALLRSMPLIALRSTPGEALARLRECSPATPESPPAPPLRLDASAATGVSVGKGSAPPARARARSPSHQADALATARVGTPQGTPQRIGRAAAAALRQPPPTHSPAPPATAPLTAEVSEPSLSSAWRGPPRAPVRPQASAEAGAGGAARGSSVRGDCASAKQPRDTQGGSSDSNGTLGLVRGCGIDAVGREDPILSRDESHTSAHAGARALLASPESPTASQALAEQLVRERAATRRRAAPPGGGDVLPRRARGRSSPASHADVDECNQGGSRAGSTDAGTAEAVSDLASALASASGMSIGGEGGSATPSAVELRRALLRSAQLAAGAVGGCDSGLHPIAVNEALVHELATGGKMEGQMKMPTLSRAHGSSRSRPVSAFSRPRAAASAAAAVGGAASRLDPSRPTVTSAINAALGKISRAKARAKASVYGGIATTRKHTERAKHANLCARERTGSLEPTTAEIAEALARRAVAVEARAAK